MKKIIILILLYFLRSSITYAQTGFGTSSDNHNVNNSSYADEGRRSVINATVKLVLTEKDGSGTLCTGTLINRNTSDNDVGYYIITARHCLFADNGTGSYVFDPDEEHDVIFNFQSPNSLNDDTFLSNRGIVRTQSNGNDVLNGYEYLHRTRLRLVDAFFWGDFALMEIMTPVPPHYNFSYAGWYSSKFGTASFPPATPAPFVNIHHPKGDIKKINGTNSILWAESPIATGCYIVTTIIDVLFGWIWGHKVSTNVICNYVDNPWIVVPSYTYGSYNNGSSGSSLFYQSNQILGVLSGPVNSYGKFHANYYNASIKNVLNPSNDLWVDLQGIEGRTITQYDDLVLPGGNLENGFYFPANHYQPENKITLRAINNIETNRPIIIFEEADYEFIAGNSIVLRDGFEARTGSNFKAKISSLPQKSASITKATLEENMIEKLNNLQLPPTLSKVKGNNFNINKNEINIYPNPTNGIVNVGSTNEVEITAINVFDISGRLLRNVVDFANNSLDLSYLNDGMYILKIQSSLGETVHKVTIKK